jgi:hypothetical protein
MGTHVIEMNVTYSCQGHIFLELRLSFLYMYTTCDVVYLLRVILCLFQMNTQFFKKFYDETYVTVFKQFYSE